MERSPLAIGIFAAFVLLTIGITVWAGRRKTDAGGMYVADGQLTGGQNGLAIVGDLLSASSLLGTVGLVALVGVQALFLVVGMFVALVILLMVLAEPLRNLGKFTLADAVASRFRARDVRVAMAFNSLLITVFYMIGQLVAAGSLLSLLLKVDYSMAVVGVGLLMTLYIVVGGMLAASWIQIVKAVMLLTCVALLFVLVMGQFGFSVPALLAAAKAASPKDLFAYAPGPLPGLNVLSMSIGVVLGTAALPHILIRFLTVPNVREARKSLNIALLLMGPAFFAIPLIGLGAVALVGAPAIQAANAGGNLATLQVAQMLGGEWLFALVAAVAFATILAVVSGLLIAGSGALAHDLYNSILRKGQASEREQVMAGRLAAVSIAIISIVIAILARDANVAILGALAVSVAASANVPILLLLLFWRRFNSTGVVTGAATGLLSALVMIAVGPKVMGADAIFPIDYPALFSMPLGFIGCYLGTILSSRRSDETSYDDIRIGIAFGAVPAGKPD